MIGDVSRSKKPLGGPEPAGKARLIGPEARRPASDHKAKKPSWKGVAPMPARRMFALVGAILALTLTSAAVASAAGTTVTVRVEGLTRTLLAPVAVHTHSGTITTGGTPAGACPSTSAAGALDLATHHRFNGTYGSFGLSVTQILGETHPFTPPSYYWSVWVDNRYAPAGVCALKLHRGEQLLFAAVPDKGSEYPIVITAPGRATAGQPFKLHVFYYSAKGAAKPLAGAAVRGAGPKAVTNGHGVLSITAQHTGRLTFGASEHGYIRAAPVTVRVSK